MLWSIRFCSKSLSYADNLLALDETLVAFMDSVYRLEDVMDRSELIRVG